MLAPPTPRVSPQHVARVSTFILALTLLLSDGFAQTSSAVKTSQPPLQNDAPHSTKTLTPELPVPAPETDNKLETTATTPSPPSAGETGAKPQPTEAREALSDELKSQPDWAKKGRAAKPETVDTTKPGKEGKTTPPANPVSPHDIIVPAENSSPTAVPDAPAAPQLPAEKAAEMAKQALPRTEAQRKAAELLTSLGVFKAGMLDRLEPLTRAEWAGVLVRALKHNTEMYELFPFYRDIPRMHPDYVVIEVARAKKLIQYPDDHGFYYPDRAITFAEAYRAISRALTGHLPGVEEQDALLKPFGGRAAIGEALSPAIAKMTRLRFFVTGTGHLDTQLRLYEHPTPNEVAPFVVSLMHIIELRGAAVNTDEDNVAAVLPANLTLSLTPNTAVVEEQLVPGQRLFFSLVQAVTPLPRQSRARALVREVSKAERRYVLLIDEIRTPEDVYYRTQAELVIQFQPRRRNAFIVPGQLFETVTQPLPVPQYPTGTSAAEESPGSEKSPTPASKQQQTPPVKGTPGQAKGMSPPPKTSPMIKIPLRTDKK